MEVQDYNGEATEDIIDESSETEVMAPQDDTETNEESSQNVPPKPKSSTYRVTCNTCNKNLSSRSITVHNRMLHGLRGTPDSLLTRVLDPIPEFVQPTPEPSAVPVEDISAENQENRFKLNNCNAIEYCDTKNSYQRYLKRSFDYSFKE